MSARRGPVSIIGGGYAGMAAAVRLAEAGVAVRVFESGPRLGGRARAIAHQGETLDNGQHILIGAYTSLRALMQTVGVHEPAVLLRLPLEMRMHPDFHLRTPALPAPFHLAWGLATAQGVTWKERMAATRLTRLVERPALPASLRGGTVEALLQATGQPPRLIEVMWLPLCIAALNTPIESASAEVFARVMRDALFQKRQDSDFLLPRTDLTSLFPQPAADWLIHRGHRVETGSRIRSLVRAAGGWHLEGRPAELQAEAAPAVIVAVGPHQLTALTGLPADLSVPTAFEPICTVYLQFEDRVMLPGVMTGQSRGMVQWFFQREDLGGPRGLVAGVISATGPHEALGREALAARAVEELSGMAGILPPLRWHQVITERFATFACTPDARRAPVDTGLPGVFLAGDHVEGPYPATLEGAVRSGEAAALRTIRYLADGAGD